MVENPCQAVNILKRYFGFYIHYHLQYLYCDIFQTSMAALWVKESGFSTISSLSSPSWFLNTPLPPIAPLPLPSYIFIDVYLMGTFGRLMALYISLKKNNNTPPLSSISFRLVFLWFVVLFFLTFSSSVSFFPLVPFQKNPSTEEQFVYVSEAVDVPLIQF